MKRAKHIYIGLDLHKFQHTAVILDCWFEKLGEMTFPNKPSVFPSLLECMNKYLTEGLTPVFGLEDVGGYGRDLALYLLEKGYIVKFVNSSLSNAERNSYAMTQKNDSWDAQCVARVLIRDLPYLPEATPSDIHWIIAQLVGRRNALVKAQTALAFWESYPSPSHLEGATVEDIRTFLLEASNNACSTRKAEKILSLVQADGEVNREYQTSRDFIIQSIVRDIRFKKQEIKKVDRELKMTIQTLSMQLETMPGIDTVTSSALIAEIGDIYRFATSNKLARYAGIAPIKMGSGGM